MDRPRARSPESVEQSRRQALEAWEHIAKALVGSPDKVDQALALDVVEYVGREFKVPVRNKPLDRAPGRGSSDPSPTR